MVKGEIMNELKTMPDDEYNKLLSLLENYKSERKELLDNYRKQTKKLTFKIDRIEANIQKERRIRQRRGKEYTAARNEKMLQMYMDGVAYKDLAKEFKITHYTVRSTIDRIIRRKNIAKRWELLKKTNGVVNDNFPIETILWYEFGMVKSLKNKNINTIGDFYKLKNKLKISEHIQEKIEQEIKWSEERYREEFNV